MQRIEWLDKAKFIAIVGIVIQHIPDLLPSLSVRYVVSFNLALFWFLSGYLQKYKITITELAMKKFKRLLIPYAGFCGIAYLYSFLGQFFGLKDTQIKSIWVYFQSALLGMPIDKAVPLWFLPALFLIMVVFGLLNNKYRIILAGILTGVSYIAHYMAVTNNDIFPTPLLWLRGVSIGFVFYAVGYYSKNYSPKDFAKFCNIKVLAFVSLMINLGLFYLASHFFINNYLNFIYSVYILGVSGIITWILIAYIIPSNKVIQYIGRNTLTLLGLHYIVMMFIQKANKILLRKYGVPDLFIEKKSFLLGQLAAGLGLAGLTIILTITFLFFLERYVFSKLRFKNLILSKQQV